MKFRSLLGQSPQVTFRQALLDGLAPDGSLYEPAFIPQLSPSLVHQEPSLLQAIALEVLRCFIDDIPRDRLSRIIQRSFSFPIPLVKIEDGMFLLELFHGPTLAFKDVGARFMAEALSFFLEATEQTVTVLVATSGDTGSAVAHGFFGVPRVLVYILYPSGKISHLQEQQMTTLGGNIHALEVHGTFDDCQRLVKQALGDDEIATFRTLTTSNSINIGRLLPQIAYYLWGVVQLQELAGAASPVVVVPSGNFGNLTAGVYAKWMGAPIMGFTAATNVNDIIPIYLATGRFTPRPSVQTLSNAMDVGNPSNVARLQALYGYDIARIRSDIQAVRVTDEETVAEIRRTHRTTGYILDPHTAVGVSAARRLKRDKPGGHPIIVPATAHPGKFPDAIEQAIGLTMPPPPQLLDALHRRKQSILMEPDYQVLKGILLTDS